MDRLQESIWHSTTFLNNPKHGASQNWSRDHQPCPAINGNLEHSPNIWQQAPCQHQDQTGNIPSRCTVTTALLCSHQPTKLHPQRCQTRIHTQNRPQTQSSILHGWSKIVRQAQKRPDSPEWGSSNLHNRYLLRTRKMCKANHPTWKYRNNRRTKSRHRKNQGHQHWNRLQISGRTPKHAEQTKRGRTQSNNKLQKKVKADSQITPQCQKQIQAINTYAMPVITYTAGIIDWNKRDTGSRQNDKEHVRRTSPKGRHSLVVPSKKRRQQRIEKSCSNSQIPMCRNSISKAKEKDSLIQAVWKHQATKGYFCKKEKMEEWEIENTANSYMGSTNGK